MNLELLFWASKATRVTLHSEYIACGKDHEISDKKSGWIIIWHAMTLRPGISLKAKHHRDTPTSLRGLTDKVGGIYGFTLCYRETKDPRFLKTAQRMADYYINHPNLPSDKIREVGIFDTHRQGFVPGKVL